MATFNVGKENIYVHGYSIVLDKYFIGLSDKGVV